MVLAIFFKDHRCQMTPKLKNITSSSGIVIAATLMDGTSPHKVLLSGKEWISPLLHTTRDYLLEAFAIAEHEETLSLNFFLKMDS